MGKALQVQVLATESIKPAYPTPPHLRSFKLCLLDQITYPIYMIGVLFYKNDETDGDLNLNVIRISQRLKLSLSETLTKFYPIAGRIKDDFSIECNDDGIEYIEARANVFMSEYLQKPDQKSISELHPFGTKSIIETGKAPLLIVQATFFKCGGVAIAACYSHRLLDALSFTTFLYSWAAVARGESIKVPKYIAEASVFPPSESFLPVPVHFSPRECIELKRFVFDASKLDKLKAKVASSSVPRPTRADALTALIWKCARAATTSNRGFSRSSMLVHAMNMRTVVVPPLPLDSVGNCVGYFSAQTSKEEVELQDLVCILWKAKKEFTETGLKILQETKSILSIPESIREEFEREEIDFFTFSSMGTFPGYKVADFGWGKPIYINVPNYDIPNLIMFMPTADDTGIEALVSLSPEDMALFERNKELLAFATVDPPFDVNQKEKVSSVLKSSL